jgi:hypothetical protein
MSEIPFKLEPFDYRKGGLILTWWKTLKLVSENDYNHQPRTSEAAWPPSKPPQGGWPIAGKPNDDEPWKD